MAIAYDNYADAAAAYNERMLQEYLDKDDEEEEEIEEKDWVLEAILKEQKKSSK